MTTKRFCTYALLLGWLAAAFGILFVGYNQGPATLRMGPPIRKPPLPPPGPAPTPLATQLLDAHNQQRAAHGLAPLTIDPKLQASAQGHSDFQAKVKKMAHQGIGDGTPFTRMQADGYSFSSAGENIAWNQQTVKAVMTAWMSDPGHRANILGNYKEVGLAVTDRYWTVDFGTPWNLGVAIQVLNTTAPVETHDADSAASSTSTTTLGDR